ncbi:AIR synthase-related protein, partial [Lactiplantibacillus paraplantarum]
PAGLSAHLELGQWPVPPIMPLLAELGDLTATDLRSTFNLGLGMVLIVHPDQVATVIAKLTATQQPYYQVGTVQAGSTPVVFEEAQHG